MPIKLAIIGAGKIATDEHRPAIAAGNTFELVALVDPGLDTYGRTHLASHPVLPSADVHLPASHSGHDAAPGIADAVFCGQRNRFRCNVYLLPCRWWSNQKQRPQKNSRLRSTYLYRRRE